VTSVVHVSHLGLPPSAFELPVLEYTSLLDEPAAPLAPLPVPFEHPLWVLYSSGTTGLPKGIVHGHGGVVLEHLKIVGLHFDLGPGDRLFWYTTTNWMMWNFAIAALLIGASTVTYDGSPAQPEPDRFWRVAAQSRATVVGASPAYLQSCERHGCRPTRSHDLRAVRLIGCTGSPVPASCHHWVRKHFGPAVPLQSSSGGTDIVSGLAGGSPTVPVWAGELSCPNLGVALDAFDEAGHPVRDTVGELVVSAPMPTMPLRFVGDPDGDRYRDTYFATYPGVWRHGDWVTVTQRGTIVIHGRSDATLNRNGVRLGSAEIYAIVESVPGVREALVVGVELPDGRYWMPLFVVLDKGLQLDDALRRVIVERLQRGASPRHVPDDIVAVPAIPHTRTGKKLEVPVKRILAGDNLDAVVAANAVDDVSSLAPFIELAKQARATRSATPRWHERGRRCQTR
jgi:acetoacetyl-CoA synthetase